MTEFTVNFDLPYPSGSDAPCDFAEQWCDFTEALEGVFTGFQRTIDRTVPVIPIAALKFSAPFSTLGVLPFDTVMIDSAGWVDADIDPSMISPDIVGIITMIANATTLPAGNSTILIDYFSDGVTLSGADPLNFNNELDRNTEFVGVFVDQQYLLSPGTWVRGVSGIRPLLSEVGFASIQVNWAYYSIYWHADGGTF